uniref:Uncharacterized protein n=1 Tax=Arundo donax TaxID=35708 RepID=A0A0A9DS22_ARUDO
MICVFFIVKYCCLNPLILFKETCYAILRSDISFEPCICTFTVSCCVDEGIEFLLVEYWCPSCPCPQYIFKVFHVLNFVFFNYLFPVHLKFMNC